MEKQNNIFDNIKLNIVDGSYDYKERISDGKGVYYCTNCILIVDAEGLMEIKNGLPNTIKCPVCGELMIHQSLIEAYNIMLEKIKEMDDWTKKKFDAIKLMSSVTMKLMEFLRKNKLKKLYINAYHYFDMAINIAVIFMDIEVISRVEQIYIDNNDILRGMDEKIKEAKERLIINRLIYDYIDADIEYKQVDIVKNLQSKEKEWCEEFHDIKTPFFMENSYYYPSYQDLFWKWGKAGLLYRENRKGRVYIRKDIAYYEQKNNKITT